MGSIVRGNGSRLKVWFSQSRARSVEPRAPKYVAELGYVPEAAAAGVVASVVREYPIARPLTVAAIRQRTLHAGMRFTEGVLDSS